MSLPSSPSRRRRRDRDDDGFSDAFEHSVTEQPNKRPRHNHEDEEEEEVEEEDRPVLPDNYRRSPKGKRRARDSSIMANDGSPRQEHQPGSIVRVKLTDFVTYSKAEFHPGPNLNMVIGPNGTGKSTLVCAICIGLGWSTAHLGRAKDVTEFVKHGKKSAEIEIELKADLERHTTNQVITHIIAKDKTTAKSTFKINGRKSSAKDVQALARSFSIQVDNLCQFLPQDRVVEFAALSPVDLLVQTQRAAAPDHMSDWHDQLKQMGKEHRHKQADQQRCIDDLKRAEDRQRAQEDMVTRLRERNALQESIQVMEKMKPFAIYKAHIEKHSQAKQRRKAAAAELKRLKERMAPNMEAVQSKSAYHERTEDYAAAQTRMLKRLDAQTDSTKKSLDATAAKADECDKELESERDNGKTARANIMTYQREITKLENAFKNPPAEFDPTDINAEIRDKKTQIRTIESEREEAKTAVENLQEQARQRQTIIEEQQQHREQLQTQTGQQNSRLQSINKEAATAWRWLQENRSMFSGEVFGPPVVECSVKNTRHADIVETIIGSSELLAFTATSQADFNILRAQLHGRMNLATLPLRTVNSPLSSHRPPCSREQLRQLGGQEWVVDLVEGPDALLAMLCNEANIHAKAYTTADLSNAQFEALKRSEIQAMATPTKMFQITRRREYGDAGISTRLVDVKQAKLLGEMPVNTQEEQDIDRRITQVRGELDHIKQEIAGCHSRYRQLASQVQQKKREVDEIQKQKDEKLAQKATFDGLKPKLEALQRKLETNKDMLQAQSEKRMGIIRKRDALVLEKGQQAIYYAIAANRLREMHVTVLEAEIMRIEAKSDMEQLQDQHRAEQDLLDRTARELDETKSLEAQLKQEGFPLERQCRQIADGFSGAEREYHTSKDGAFTLEQLNIDIEQVQAQLDSLHGGNDNIIKEFEERARYIERKRAQRDNVAHEVEKLSMNIANLREQWEPELDRIIGQISEAFADNFSRIHCAGEVAVHKDEDFEHWAIEIRVKFRENEQLSVLDAHRQSGGERAVSTIFYLMALQSLARAPFRVVDEINQGMDPRNERLVHSRMVEIACAEHTSQYFLITPKLLNNLAYHKGMKVHCIASGEYMPEDYRQLDFGMLAKKALTMRAGAN